MSKQVLIVIDNTKRELFGCTLLAHYLSAQGIRPILCSSYFFRYYYARYAPDAVVRPNALMDHSELARKSFVFVLPAESGNGQPHQVKATHGGTSENPAYPASVDRFFCWGPAMKEVLLETGRWREDQLIVTGGPSTDHWLLPRPNVRAGPPTVGVTTTFRALSNACPPNRLNHFQWLDEAETSGGDGTYYVPPEHAESWIFFEASLARVVVTLTRAIVRECDAKITIRPHPFEHPGRYRFFEKMGGERLVVTKRGTITEWVDHLSVLFTFLSSSAVDAVVRGIPVVSLKGVLDPAALGKIPVHFRYGFEEFLWQMDDLGQAREYIRMAENGKLDPCRDERGFSDYLARHFSYPRTRPSAELIAMEIRKVLEGESDRKLERRRAEHRRSEDLREMLCRYVPLSPEILSTGHYLWGLLPGHFDMSWAYLPWRMGTRREAGQCAQRVRSAVERNVLEDSANKGD